MKLTVFLLIVCVVIGAATLSLGYVQGGWPAGAVAAVAIAGLWLAGRLLGHWPNVNSLAWLLFMLATGFGALIGLQTALMLVAAAASLCAWDLAAFEQRLIAISRIDDLSQLERRHAARLAVVAAGGLLLGWLALSVRIEFGFGLAVLIAALAALLLGLAIRLIARARGTGEWG